MKIGIIVAIVGLAAMFGTFVNPNAGSKAGVFIFGLLVFAAGAFLIYRDVRTRYPHLFVKRR